MKIIPKQCAHCGNKFNATCGIAKFCSDLCHFGHSVQKADGCWQWLGSKDKDGYGTIKLRGRRVRKAHRLSYELHKGEIPEGMQVCHSCDNPECANPSHLFIGTTQDNKNDSIAKGRHIKGTDLYWKVKLSEADVVAIRRAQGSGVTSYQLAEKYGVNAVSIQYIWKRRTWKHIA